MQDSEFQLLCKNSKACVCACACTHTHEHTYVHTHGHTHNMMIHPCYPSPTLDFFQVSLPSAVTFFVVVCVLSCRVPPLAPLSALVFLGFVLCPIAFNEDWLQEFGLGVGLGVGS